MTTNARTCLITGANAGIGRAAAIQIARRGWRVLLGCRNPERGAEAVKDVRAASGSEAVSLLEIDLASRASIERAAAKVSREHERLDALVHNAAAFDLGQKAPQRTVDGVESIWATNHLGPVLLTERLLPAMAKSEDARIVMVTSKGLAMHPKLRVCIEDPELERHAWTVPKAYYQSKLAQLIYALWLAERLKGTPVTVHAVRVTNVKVDLGRYPGLSRFWRWLYALKSRFAITPEEMALTYTWLVTAEELAGKTGGYFDGIHRQARPSRSARDARHVEEVIALTYRALGLEIT